MFTVGIKQKFTLNFKLCEFFLPNQAWDPTTHFQKQQLNKLV